MCSAKRMELISTSVSVRSLIEYCLTWWFFESLMSRFLSLSISRWQLVLVYCPWGEPVSPSFFKDQQWSGRRDWSIQNELIQRHCCLSHCIVFNNSEIKRLSDSEQNLLSTILNFTNNDYPGRGSLCIWKNHFNKTVILVHLPDQWICLTNDDSDFLFPIATSVFYHVIPIGLTIDAFFVQIDFRLYQRFVDICHLYLFHYSPLS